MDLRWRLLQDEVIKLFQFQQVVLINLLNFLFYLFICNSIETANLQVYGGFYNTASASDLNTLLVILVFAVKFL